MTINQLNNLQNNKDFILNSGMKCTSQVEQLHCYIKRMPSVVHGKNRKISKGSGGLSTSSAKPRRNRKTPFKNKICQPLIIKKIEASPANSAFLQHNPSFGFNKYRGNGLIQKKEPISSLKYANSKQITS